MNATLKYLLFFRDVFQIGNSLFERSQLLTEDEGWSSLLAAPADVKDHAAGRADVDVDTQGSGRFECTEQKWPSICIGVKTRPRVGVHSVGPMAARYRDFQKIESRTNKTNDVNHFAICVSECDLDTFWR
jgi:hypothetical protein